MVAPCLPTIGIPLRSRQLLYSSPPHHSTKINESKCSFLYHLVGLLLCHRQSPWPLSQLRPQTSTLAGLPQRSSDLLAHCSAVHIGTWYFLFLLSGHCFNFARRHKHIGQSTAAQSFIGPLFNCAHWQITITPGALAYCSLTVRCLIVITGRV